MNNLELSHRLLTEQDLSFDEFERALDEFLEREAGGFDELPASTFFELMAKIEQEKMEYPIEPFVVAQLITRQKESNR